MAWTWAVMTGAETELKLLTVASSADSMVNSLHMANLPETF
jgi:hypothetical protein